MQNILSGVRRAVDECGMISRGDMIAVGVSAGKDSLTALAALKALSAFYPEPFELFALTLDMDADQNTDYSPLREFCGGLGVPFHLKYTDIRRIVFDIRKESNPCSLCAKLRRGILNDAAKALGANKVALGHHMDDFVETFFLNLFYEGRIGTFKPVTYLDRTDLTVIRPMIFTPEKTIAAYAREAGLPVIKSSCPANGHTKRQFAKEYVRELSHRLGNPNFREQVLGALRRGGMI